MGPGPQDSTPSVSLPRCCLPVPARFFQHHSASISDQAPVVNSHGKERQPPGSSRGNRIVQLSRNADDYRLHFPLQQVPLPLGEGWGEGLNDEKSCLVLLPLLPSPCPLPQEEGSLKQLYKFLRVVGWPVYLRYLVSAHRHIRAQKWSPGPALSLAGPLVAPENRPVRISPARLSRTALLTKPCSPDCR